LECFCLYLDLQQQLICKNIKEIIKTGGVI